MCCSRRCMLLPAHNPRLFPPPPLLPSHSTIFPRSFWSPVKPSRQKIITAWNLWSEVSASIIEGPSWFGFSEIYFLVRQSPNRKALVEVSIHVFLMMLWPSPPSNPLIPTVTKSLLCFKCLIIFIFLFLFFALEKSEKILSGGQKKKKKIVWMAFAMYNTYNNVPGKC